MPRRKKNPEQDGADQNQVAQAQTDTPKQDSGYMEQEAAANGPRPDTAEPAEETIPEQTGTELDGQPDTLVGYIAKSVKDDIREFMQMFGINGHQPEAVFDAIKGIAALEQTTQHEFSSYPSPTFDSDRFDEFIGYCRSGDVSHDILSEMLRDIVDYEAETEIAERTQNRQPEVPLSVRISSLEMDGDTRAFAIAEYGDLTINRVRVKEDGYGTLSVNMPKYRSPEGWRDTCRFTTTEARNRLTSTVLDAYQQKLTQLQGVSQEQTATDAQATGDGQVDAQAADESQAPDQGVEPTDASDMDEPEQGGFGMSMSQ
ncbi:SpoVG family protein [Ruminococcaceae bacterium OttesenSCG-928-D13]|nr:SpoVG family protein [Ruminococcaceae bacterium OttesenSCG-928-D13]